jgi:hypothetical protein
LAQTKKEHSDKHNEALKQITLQHQQSLKDQRKMIEDKHNQQLSQIVTKLKSDISKKQQELDTQRQANDSVHKEKQAEGERRIEMVKQMME